MSTNGTDVAEYMLRSTKEGTSLAVRLDRAASPQNKHCRPTGKKFYPAEHKLSRFLRPDLVTMAKGLSSDGRSSRLPGVLARGTLFKH